jgi:hypothetical protein
MADNKAKMEDARKRAEEAANAGNDMISKMSTTYKAGANKDFKRAIADFKKVPQDVRDAEAYQHAGYKKGGVMKKKVRKFEEGGYMPPDVAKETYTKEAEDFLGKADRTDPFIISRMKKAVPDYEKRTPAPVEEREVKPAAAKTEQNGADRLSLQTRQEVLQKQADKESAERNFDYDPSYEEGRESSRFKKPVSAARPTGGRRTLPASASPARAAATKPAVKPAVTASRTSRADMADMAAAPTVRRNPSVTADKPADKPMRTLRFPRFPSAGTMADKISGRDRMPFAKGGSVSSASKRADGIAQRGKTRA